MKKYRIVKTGNSTRVLVGCLLFLFTLYVFAPITGDPSEELSVFKPLFFLVAGPPVALIIYLWYRKNKIMRDRKGQIIALAQTNGYQIYGEAPQQVIDDTRLSFNATSLATLAEKEVDVETNNRILKDDWIYGDYSFDFYRHTKNGKYKAGKIHYAIIAFKLPRHLPHVMFDSFTSNKMQFRMIFDSKQKHSLEGNFDKYFNTYFAPEYTIDSLSFITPEVMQAMIDASNYDIEIIDDKLYLFGPLEHPDIQIPQMVMLGSRIKTKLLNNILTYRDERLGVVEGRQGVAAQGMRLKRNKWPAIISAVTAVLYVLFYVIDIFMD